MNEVEFPYTYRSEVYAGTPKVVEGAPHYVKSTHDLTMKLLSGYGWRKLHGCNLTTDNLYTSIRLARALAEKKVTLLGTLRMNRRGLAKEMKNMVDRLENSKVVWHELTHGNICIVSYVVKTKSKGKKNILLLCTIPHLATLGITKDDGKYKPAAFKVYDFSKGGTDIMDQRMGVYTTATKSRR